MLITTGHEVGAAMAWVADCWPNHPALNHHHPQQYPRHMYMAPHLLMRLQQLLVEHCGGQVPCLLRQQPQALMCLAVVPFHHVWLELGLWLLLLRCLMMVRHTVPFMCTANRARWWHRELIVVLRVPLSQQHQRTTSCPV